MHLYPPIQHIEAFRVYGRPLERLLAALGGVLCVILHLNFGEYPFYEVG
jgi:hypothetical protein